MLGGSNVDVPKKSAKKNLDFLKQFKTNDEYKFAGKVMFVHDRSMNFILDAVASSVLQAAALSN